MIQFADSTAPRMINPAQFSHVAAYADGRYAWPDAQVARFPAHVKISVTGDPAAAAEARVQDVERFDATPAQFPPFAAQRILLGHDDPTAYTAIEPDAQWGLAAVLAAIKAAHLQTWRLWIAWWWGRPFPPTATEVLTEIATLTNIQLPASRLWACQWQRGTAYDSSVLYQRDDFTKQAAA